MKIIGKTESGYLVEASLAELANVAGSQRLDQAGFVKERAGPNGYGRDFHIPIGSTLNVSERFKTLDALEGARDRVLSSVSSLRGLADLLDKAIPPGLVIPAAPPAPTPTPQDDSQ